MWVGAALSGNTWRGARDRRGGECRLVVYMDVFVCVGGGGEKRGVGGSGWGRCQETRGEEHGTGAWNNRER